MTTLYYISDKELVRIPESTIVSFNLEQAIIRYKIREDSRVGSSDINSILPAMLYQFEHDFVFPDMPDEDALKNADLDYHLKESVLLPENSLMAHLRDMLFHPDVRLRELLLTKSVDDISKWLSKYRPDVALDQYLTVNLRLMQRLGEAVFKNIFSRDETLAIHSDLVLSANLQTKLINEYSIMENNILQLKAILKEIKSSDSLEAVKSLIPEI